MPKLLRPVFIFFAVFLLLPLNSQAQPIPGSFANLVDQVSDSVVNVAIQQKVDEAAPGSSRTYRFEFGPGQGPQEMPRGLPGPFQDFFEDFFGQPMPPQGAPDAPDAEPEDKAQPFSAPQRPLNAVGSGFIIDAEQGYVITNFHVIKRAEKVIVTLQDDTEFDAEIVGHDPKTDIAVLKIDPNEHDDAAITAVEWGDSDAMRVGDWILAVGNPFGLGGSVTSGIISARQRDINAGPYDDFIQTDAPINRGNSGGPMFNMAGEVIGINTAIFSPTGGSVGIGFAVPANLAINVVDQLIEYGQTKRGWLGVQIQHVTEDIAQSLGLEEAKGALVADVTDESPAGRADIKVGDIIVAFDGQEIEEMRQLPRLVAETEVGSDVVLKIWRKGDMIEETVTLGQLEKAEEEGLIDSFLADDQSGSVTPDDKETDVAELGIHAAPLNSALRRRFGLAEDREGLVILDVDRRSDAAAKGLRPGDVIEEANQIEIEDIPDLKEAIAEVKDDDKNSILLLVQSEKGKRFIAVKLKNGE